MVKITSKLLNYYWWIRNYKLLWAVVRPRPRFLYKFHPVNNYLFDLIEFNSIYACSADQLNDPYDSDFDYSYEFIKTKFLDQITVEDYSGSLSDQELSKAKDYIKKNPDGEFFNWRILHAEYKKFLGVCCFTTQLKSELMWSHYAQSGKGICLVFNFPFKSEIATKLIKVTYSNKRILVKDDISRFYGLFQKRKAWTYENEWRILAGIGSIKFNRKHLEGIIFGPRCVEETKLSLIEKCREMGYNIDFSTCSYTPKGIIIEKMDINQSKTS